MLRQRLNRVTAAVLALVWLYGAGLQLAELNHPFDDDVACGDVGPGRPGAGSSLRVASDQSGDGHCGACHLRRALSHAVLLGSSQTLHDGPAVDSLASPPQLAVVRYVQYSSPRAPPAL